MRIHFGMEFDEQIWGGPPREAAFDELTCGPLQLVAELESQLGVPSITTPVAVRAAALLPRLAGVADAYWLRSAESDALGTAMRLICDYDALMLAGWQPDTGSLRLQQLGGLCSQIPFGLGERLHRVITTLAQRTIRLKQLALYDSFNAFSGLWKVALGALAQKGVELTEQPALEPVSYGDLGAAARRQGAFKGDGSLQCLRPWGALEAAEHVAAWIAADRVEDTVVITPDAVLDAALARYGLPTLGLHTGAGSGATQLIPLSLALAWAPIDPQHAVEWLSTTPNPMSQKLRGRLMDALTTWPAVGSPDWNEASQHASAHEKAALAALFAPQFNRLQGGYETRALSARCEYLKNWFATLNPQPQEAIATCDTIQAILTASAVTAMSEGQLQRLLAWVMPRAGRAGARPAYAGLEQVGTPAAMLRPTRRVVWWNFHDEATHSERRLPLTCAEEQELAGLGVSLPAPGDVAARTAAGWRQPLAAARESLLLVSPHSSAAGEVAHPHPLWDELLAAVPRSQRAAAASRLTVSVPYASRGIPRSRRALEALPQPAIHVRVHRRSLRREGAESPSSLETLLGCSFKWALRYIARLEDGNLPAVTASAQHVGSFAHSAFQNLVMRDDLQADAAAREALQHFDTQGPLLLAPLFLPGMSSERDAVRSTLEHAARHFFKLRDHHGWRVAATEIQLTKPLGKLTLQGRLDARLTDPLAVVDFKWGGSSWYSEKLRNNTASQLGAYSYLSATTEDALPPVAYYILKNAKLWTTTSNALPGGVPAGGDVAVIWQALQAAVEQALPDLQGGRLTATGNLAEPVDKDAVMEGVLRVAPPCNYCDFAGLCGSAWEHAHDT